MLGNTYPLRGRDEFESQARIRKEKALTGPMAKLLDGEFNAGTFEQVWQNRALIISHRLTVAGITDPEEAAAQTKHAIIQVMEKNNTALKMSELPLEMLAGHVLQIYLPQKATDQSAKIEGDYVLEAQELISRIGNLTENAMAHLMEAAKIISGAALGITTRERIEIRLFDTLGIKIRDSDLTRLLVYEINLGSYVPKILVLPNEHKPYNPYLVTFERDSPCPIGVARLLRMFDR